MRAPQKFVAGMVLGGRYELVAPIGKGAMGEVWRAQHRGLRTPVAVKVIDPKLLDESRGEDRSELLRRFEREAHSAAALASAHVVRVLDHGVDHDVPYIAMELLAGETLSDRLERAGRLTEAQTLLVLTHVGRAMSRAHELGIIHRDLKPENVFLARVDGDTIAKVLDFGVAKVLRSPLKVSPKTTRSGAMLGTPCYMSPEQVQGIEPVEPKSDVWSMAIIAFECLTGCLPWSSESVGDLVLSICVRPIPPPSSFAPLSPPVDAWFARATDRDLSRRYQTPDALVDGLRIALMETGASPSASFDDFPLPSAPPPSLPTGVGPGPVGKATDGGVSTAVWRRPSAPRKRPLLLAAAGGVMLLAAGAGLYAALKDPAPPQPVAATTAGERGATASTTLAVEASPSASLPVPTTLSTVLSLDEPTALSTVLSLDEPEPDPEGTATSSAPVAVRAAPRPRPIPRPKPQPTGDPRLGL